MTAKLTFEFVKSKFEERDYELLETEYLNANTKMKYICNKHREKGTLYITYGCLYSGRGCASCGAKNAADKMKLDFDFVYEKFRDRNYELLETEYINAQTKMKYKCYYHSDKELSISYNSLSNGSGCPYCAKKGSPIRFEDVKSSFAERNYELLEEKYINSKTKMKFKCNIHNNVNQEISWNSFNQGAGCKLCAVETIKEKLKLTYDYVKNVIDDQGFILLEENYINARQRLAVICKDHPEEIQYISYDSISRGHKCMKCRGEKIGQQTRGENHWNWNGGISELSLYLRIHTNDWRKASFGISDSRCVISGERAEVIHHLYPFYKIMQEIIDETGIKLRANISEYDEHELEELTKKALEIQFRYGLGAALTKKIHYEFHSIYGVKDFTPEHFYEFKNKKLLELKEAI